MIYVYDCFGGTHTSVMAASYHLNLIDENHVPSDEEILKLSHFNELKKDSWGHLFFHGTDEKGNKVYTVGRGHSKKIIPALSSLSSMLQNNQLLQEKIIFSNTSPTVPPVMTIGGFLSTTLGVDSLGVPLLLKGAKQNYKYIIGLVHNTKKVAETNEATTIVLPNKEFQYSSKKSN